MATKLPVIGSTAASTAFCSARVDGPGDLHLWMDGNGKITSHNGTLAEPKPNAFSLVQIETCPGSTPTCRKSCYVHNLEAAQKATHDLYRHNTETIAKILADAELAAAWASVVGAWISANAPGGFRWHVSGDVYSAAYARWIVQVCNHTAGAVYHWIYTRSFEHVGILMRVSTLRGGNLAVNLSCDADNFDEAERISTKYATAEGAPRLCYLTTDGSLPATLEDGDVIFPDYNLRPRQFATLAESPWWQGLTPDQRKMVCPVDAHNKSEKNRCGPCTRCLT